MDETGATMDNFLDEKANFDTCIDVFIYDIAEDPKISYNNKNVDIHQIIDDLRDDDDDNVDYDVLLPNYEYYDVIARIISQFECQNDDFSEIIQNLNLIIKHLPIAVDHILKLIKYFLPNHTSLYNYYSYIKKLIPKQLLINSNNNISRLQAPDLNKNWLYKNMYTNSLNPTHGKEEPRFLGFYPGYGGDVINYILRNNLPMPRFLNQVVQALTNLLDQADPYPDDIYFFRGIIDDYITSQGNNFVLKGFNSQTYVFSIIKGFTKDLILKLNYPPGSKFIAYYVGLAEFSSMYEILTYPNSYFKITNKFEYTIGLPVYEAELVNYEPINYNIDEEFDQYFLALIDLIKDIELDLSGRWNQIYYVAYREYNLLKRLIKHLNININNYTNKNMDDFFKYMDTLEVTGQPSKLIKQIVEQADDELLDEQPDLEFLYILMEILSEY